MSVVELPPTVTMAVDMLPARVSFGTRKFSDTVREVFAGKSLILAHKT